MPIKELATEILFIIFRYVGSRELKRNRSVAVCQRWYPIIKKILVEHIRLSGTQHSKLSENDRQHISSLTNSLHLELDIALPMSSRANWALPFPLENAKHQLNEIADLITSSPSLHTLTLRAHQAVNPRWQIDHDIWFRYFKHISLTIATCSTRLSHLSLDTGSHWLPIPKGFCLRIARIIPSLRSIRTQLGWTCADILDFDQEGMTGTPRIEKIVICLSSLSKEERHAYHTWDESIDGLDISDMLNELESKAREAAHRFSALKSLWILCHAYSAHPLLTVKEHVTMTTKCYPRSVYEKDGFDCTAVTSRAEGITVVKDFHFGLS